jgi:hypothetical protein
LILNIAPNILPHFCNTIRTLSTAILCLGLIKSVVSETLYYSHNCMNVGYSTISKLLLINVSGLHCVCHYFCKMCHFEYYSYYCFRKLTQLNDGILFYRFFSVAIKKKQWRAIRNLIQLFSSHCLISLFHSRSIFLMK